MNLKRVFYACDNGKDYVITLSEGSRVIRLIDLSGLQTEYRMKDHREACSQIKLWMKNSVPRLPKTFVVKTDETSDLTKLRNTLAENDLTLPEARLLKSWIIYHGNQFTVMDGDFEPNQIPILNLEDLQKISRRIRRNIHPRMSKPAGGIFSEVSA
jgi:hypothetical protein